MPTTGPTVGGGGRAAGEGILITVPEKSELSRVKDGAPPLPPPTPSQTVYLLYSILFKIYILPQR